MNNANYYTVREALDFLRLNGVEWTEVYFRSLIGLGKIKSEKQFNSRVISVNVLSKIIQGKRKGK